MFKILVHQSYGKSSRIKNDAIIGSDRSLSLYDDRCRKYVYRSGEACVVAVTCEWRDVHNLPLPVLPCVMFP